MVRRLTIVFSRFGSGAGAEGTLTDFCKAFLEKGNRCDVIVGKSSLTQRSKFRRQLAGTAGFPKQNLSIVSASRLIDFRVARAVRISDFGTKPSLPLTSLRFLLNPARIRARTILSRATTVLVGQVLSERGLSEIRALCPEATFVLNHNGEPKDFYSNWTGRLVKENEKYAHAKDVQYEKFLSTFSEVLFQSHSQERVFTSLFPRNTAITRVIWPSCNEEEVSRQENGSNPLNPDFFNIVCVAKFQESKGQLSLLKAFRETRKSFPLSRLTFVGGTVAGRAYLDECLAYVRAEGIAANVSFVGHRTDAPRFIAHSDLFALSSVGEGVSRAVREAAFLQKPILTTAQDGLESFLSPEGAFFARSNAAEDVTSVLAYALKNPMVRKRRAEVAAGRYAELAKWELFSAAVQELI